MSARYTDPARVSGMRVTDVPRYGAGAFYGPKLPTRYMLTYAGRERRVYAMSYGNAASVYVVVAGNDVFLDTDTEHALMAAGAAA